VQWASRGAPVNWELTKSRFILSRENPNAKRHKPEKRRAKEKGANSSFAPD
jgi:hypothetical protein